MSRLMKPRGLLVLGLVFLFAADAKEDDIKKEQAKLKGTWKMVDGERGGQKPPEEVLNNFKITFPGDDKVIIRRGTDQEGTFKLDPSKKPKQIELTREDRTIKGIYQVEKDDLKLCLARGPNDEVPTEFASKEGSRTQLMIFKREKEKK